MLRILKNTPSNVLKLKNCIQFPKKFKGTILEKWADYWKNLFIDYRQMLQDLRSDIQDEPMKAIKWSVGIASAYTLAKNNPDEIDFKDTLKRKGNEIALVSDSCLNTKSADHLRFLDTCYNQGVIHYKSFGVVSIMYVSDLSESCDLYKAHCSYMQPTYFNMLSRIIDVGLMGRWWNIYIKTTNYDVNYENL